LSIGRRLGGCGDVQDYGELRLTGGGLGWVKRAAQQFPKADDSGAGQLALLEECPVASWSKATVVEKLWRRRAALD
jgi:hypothetical protein